MEISRFVGVTVTEKIAASGLELPGFKTAKPGKDPKPLNTKPSSSKPQTPNPFVYLYGDERVNISQQTNGQVNIPTNTSSAGVQGIVPQPYKHRDKSILYNEIHIFVYTKI